MNNDKEFDVAYKKDIDKKMAEKLGMDIKAVSSNTDYLFKRLRKMMEDPEIAEIKFGKLGHFYVTVPFARYKLKRDTKRLNNLADKLTNIFKYAKTVKFSGPNWFKMHTLPRILHPFYTKGNNLEQLEHTQNNARKRD